jgi:hypothetical protein
VKALVEATVTTTVITVGYFLVPMTSEPALDGIFVLIGGLVLVAALLAWQVRAILVAPYPAARAVATILVIVPLFLVVFATIYYVTGRVEPDNWSEPLTKLDAMYYTVTVFATVGFGDISAVSPTARALTTVQMVTGLAMVGLIARVVVGAVQVNLRRQAGK